MTSVATEAMVWTMCPKIYEGRCTASKQNMRRQRWESVQAICEHASLSDVSLLTNYLRVSDDVAQRRECKANTPPKDGRGMPVTTVK